jgi:ElaB/YqjD/DUF883 family membrane-anchored ribosome-binding protein
LSTQTNRDFGMQEFQPERFSSAGTASAVKEKAQEMASTVKEKAQEMASTVATRAEDAWDTAKHGVQQAASTVATSAGQARDTVAQFMRSYPYATLFVGMGLGLLLSRLLQNSSPKRFQGGQD